MIETEFRDAMAQAGLSTKEPIISDGAIHRIHLEGDSQGSRNGWYVLYGDDCPFGIYGSWKIGESYNWSSKASQDLTPEQHAGHKKRMQQAQELRRKEEDKRRKESAAKALNIWKSAPSAPENHPYIKRKGIKVYGIRVYEGSIIIPLRDASGLLKSLQFIKHDGSKRFLSGGMKKGCYFPIGIPTDQICIVEGYATGASIHEATGHAVAVAFDAGNLLPVAKAIRAKFPDITINLCADNDIDSDENIGVNRAREAASAVGGLLSIAEVTNA
ncbi:MAG: toprim domain-containing protein [Pseudomonadota bacterium]|nr:toprim domain-containing protein [Pseudomonadota bacterium]